ncbi:flavin reductase family protein [Cellulomonas sp. KH9]|uniref:flavin reductase family protein n=1 Tax=Cellulomonas sp. KH9 TaxID=1855324 RepID=UPI0008E123FE|nr:flavin reductase family protein [Cellulomonas sp. KH9]SFK22590.1 NADH-FMN oxidoreductase RutF, flavin reductase (DIM6/NTAB) family [Cellulomonas sp. KH9]
MTDAGVTADALRAVAARLAAGVTVVAARRLGVEHAATVSSLTSVSLEPPLVLFCVHVDARLRDVLDDVDTWAVSVLADDQGEVADWLASPGRPAVGQLTRVPHRPGPVSGAAWVDGAAAWLDCRTEAVHRAGDHDVVVGRVLAAAQGAPDAGGLVHLRGRLRGLR